MILRVTEFCINLPETLSGFSPSDTAQKIAYYYLQGLYLVAAGLFGIVTVSLSMRAMAEAFIKAAEEAAEKWGTRAGNLVGALWAIGLLFSKLGWGTPASIIKRKREADKKEDLPAPPPRIIDSRFIGRFMEGEILGQKVWGRLTKIGVKTGVLENPTTGQEHVMNLESIRPMNDIKRKN